MLAGIADGTLPLIVGTHAVLQDEVCFASLAVVVVDEQHRFGVTQRLALRDKGGARAPHQLILSATPIPRTLAQTVYAQPALSLLDALPPWRTPLPTVVLANETRSAMMPQIAPRSWTQHQPNWCCT